MNKALFIQTNYADYPAARPRHQRTDLARADRRMGTQAWPDGARGPEPRRVHGAHQVHDPRHRRACQALRIRYRARRFRHAVHALPEVWRPGEGELQEVRLPGVRLAGLEDRGRTPVRDPRN